MNSLIKYGLYFVVAFSVLAFGAAEVWAFSIVEFVVFPLVFLFIVESRLFSKRTPQNTRKDYKDLITKTRRYENTKRMEMKD